MLFTVTAKKKFGKKIELTREHFLTIIFHNFRRELSQEYNAELKALFGDEAPSNSSVKNGFNDFNRGRRSVKGEVHEGRSKKAQPEIMPCLD